jgi:hypothetical protein
MRGNILSFLKAYIPWSFASPSLPRSQRARGTLANRWLSPQPESWDWMSGLLWKLHIESYTDIHYIYIYKYTYIYTYMYSHPKKIEQCIITILAGFYSSFSLEQLYICKYCTITIGLIAFVCRFVPNQVSPHCNAAGGRPSLFSLGCRTWVGDMSKLYSLEMHHIRVYTHIYNMYMYINI